MVKISRQHNIELSTMTYKQRPYKEAHMYN
jgi:hypothetical protein